MRVESILIEEIEVGERRREEFRNLQKLADSISKYGLFHPVVVDGRRLAAGERRLRACRDILGWLEIPCRMYDDLTEDERLEIELEENRQREDLTPYELSKNMVALTETAAKVLHLEVLPTMGKTSKGGRPTKAAVSKEVIAERIGIPRQTIERAEQHVEAVTKYPELSVAPTQKAAIDVAKKLDRMPEPERQSALSSLINEGKKAIASITGKSKPASKPKPKPASHRYATNLSQIQVFISSIQGVGAEDLSANWTERETAAFLADLRECRDGIASIVSDFESVVGEMERRAS